MPVITQVINVTNNQIPKWAVNMPNNRYDLTLDIKDYSYETSTRNS